jgi:DNA-binding NarL/FixJ family response regulator
VLTARQLEILGLVADGLSNAEIAGRLFLSEGTVKWHVRKILRALGVSNRAQAVARYLAARPPAPA